MLSMDAGPIGDTLRVRDWNEYVGQAKLKERLQLAIDAAKAETRLLDPIFLHAPPGYGKTTIAELTANRIGDDFRMVKMPIEERKFVALLRQWGGGVLFLDEIHLAGSRMQHSLYTMIEDGWFPQKSGIEVPAQHVSVIAATTERDKILAPLLDRFLVKPPFVDYTVDEMALIVAGMAERVGVNIPYDQLYELGQAASGTPRVAGSLVVAARDLSVSGQELTVDRILDVAGIDRDGLSVDAVAYLETVKKLNGRAGLSNITSMLQLPQGTVREIERDLIDKGFVVPEPQGRALTAQAYQKLERNADGAPERSADSVVARRNQP